MLLIAPQAASAPEAITKPKKQTCTRAAFHKAARLAYAGHGRISPRQVRRVRRLVHCQRKRSRRLVLFHLGRYKRAHRYRVQVARVTPYRCGKARWAIPCYIIACESRFSWTAYNSHGARGPYQFVGWDVPWPVRTKADKLAHHRMAAQLWQGGAGASHWVCA